MDPVDLGRPSESVQQNGHQVYAWSRRYIYIYIGAHSECNRGGALEPLSDPEELLGSLDGGDIRG